MKEYRYSGPASGVTLSDGTEILLWPGKTVSLPEEHDYVKVLVALKHLTRYLKRLNPPAHRLCSHQSAEAAVTAK